MKKYIIKSTHIPFDDKSYMINKKKATVYKNNEATKKFNNKILAYLYCLYLRIYYIRFRKYYKFEVEKIK